MPTRAQAVVLAERDAFGRVQRTITSRVGAEWDTLGGWNREDVPGFLERVVPLVTAAAAQVAAVVDTATAALVSEVTGEPATPVGIELPADLRGVDPDAVYERPFITTWKALKDGKDNAEALRLGRERATVIAATDVALAQRAAMFAIVSQVEVITGYVRVLTGTSCVICVAAQGIVYSTEPSGLHAGCDCGLAPIFRTLNPAQAINAAVTEEFMATDDPAAEGLDVSDDGEVSLPEVEIREHDELGPVLVRKGHRFSPLGELDT